MIFRGGGKGGTLPRRGERPSRARERGGGSVKEKNVLLLIRGRELVRIRIIRLTTSRTFAVHLLDLFEAKTTHLDHSHKIIPIPFIDVSGMPREDNSAQQGAGGRKRGGDGGVPYLVSAWARLEA